MQDLTTGTEQQISFGPGNDVLPSFAPDSYFIAFTSNRSGPNQIYLTTRHGGDAKKVPTGSGDASFPRWGAIPRFLDRRKRAGAALRNRVFPSRIFAGNH